MQITPTIDNFSVPRYNQLSEERNWIIHITVQPELIADLPTNDSNYN